MWNSVQNIVDSIDRMANTAAVRAKSSRVLSGTAMEVEFSMLNARLSEKADNLELAEEQMWRLFAEYQGTEWDGSIDYPDSFAIHDKQNDFANLQIAKSAATDPRVLAVIDHELIELLGEDADLIMPENPASQDDVTVIPITFQPHYMFDPATGERVIVTTEAAHLELAAQGWTHDGIYEE
jgi:hypothetical protein